MPEGQVLEFSAVTKRFGGVTAVSELTARVEPGVVTGFLGPNGAGKTTSLRMLLGLVRPTSGSATIGGSRYAQLARPLQTVGAVLEASSFHPGRTGAGHLAVYAQAAGLPKSRIDAVLGLVGLSDAAGRKVGGYSLGMRQRLGLAYALLGDPGVLVLDEPTNGLDPEGIRWIRGFLRELAREGRTVFVSSHLLAEVQQTVDSLLIIAHGRLVFQGGLDELSDPTEQATVVDSSDRAALAQALTAEGIPFEVLRSGLTVRGIEPPAVGQAAAAAGVALTALHKRGPALEEVFLDLVNGTRTHPSATGETIPALPAGAVTPSEAGPTADAPTAASSDEVEAPSEELESTDAAAAPVAAEHGFEETTASAEAEEASAVDGGGDRDDSADGGDPAPAGDDDLPEADPDDLTSVAAELDAESAGAPPAAAMGAAAGAAWTEEDRQSRAAEHASFAVASTGVIDIVTLDEPESADGSAARGEPGAGESGPGGADPSESEPGAGEWTAADSGESEPGAADRSESEPGAGAPGAASSGEPDADGAGDPGTAGGAEASEDWSDPAEQQPTGESRDADAHSAFVVASTGVIDIITAEQALAARDGDSDVAADQGAGGESPQTADTEHPSPDTDSAEPASPDDEGSPAAETAGPSDEPASADPGAPDDAGDPDRPWDPYVKTDADRDADRFFAAFDEAAERAAAERAAENGGETEADGAEPAHGASVEGEASADENSETESVDDHPRHHDEGGDAR